MPSFDIVKSIEPSSTFRAASLRGMFDISSEKIEEHFKGNIDLPDSWNIGVIVGMSGTGKTTIANTLYPGLIQDNNKKFSSKSVIDDFQQGSDVKKITKIFNSVGFSSPPSWLKPYNILSEGEKMRVNLAYAICGDNDPIVFDEFTSVVDRDVAKMCSFAVSKSIRRENRKFIAVSCHYDILEWLEPDWVFCTDTMDMQKKKIDRPKIKLELFKSKSRFWPVFSRYHYLSESHNPTAACYIATYNSKPVGFCSVIHFPHPNTKNIWKVHRLVVLPDYQGVGIGIKLLDFVAEVYKNDKKRIRITTSTPALIYSLQKKDRWHLKHKGRFKPRKQKGHVCNGIGNSGLRRMTTSWEYV